VIVLIDQDNVLADFERGFRETWTANHPEMEPVAENQRKSFQIRDDYPAELRSQVDAIIESPGFYRNLPPVPAAVDALHEILMEGLSLFICCGSSKLNAARFFRCNACFCE
jgi:5'-nucleotidase